MVKEVKEEVAVRPRRIRQRRAAGASGGALPPSGGRVQGAGAGAGPGRGAPAGAGAGPGPAAGGRGRARAGAGVNDAPLVRAPPLSRGTPATRFWRFGLLTVVKVIRRGESGPGGAVLYCRAWQEPVPAGAGSSKVRVGEVSALAEGCPRERSACGTMAHHGTMPPGMDTRSSVNWCRERGFKMDERVMSGAAWSGNLELRSFRGAAFGQREGGRKGGGRVLHFLPWLLYHGQARRVPPVHPPRLACVGWGRRRGGWAERKKVKLHAGFTQATRAHRHAAHFCCKKDSLSSRRILPRQA